MCLKGTTMGFELRPGLDFKAQDTRTRAWTIFFLRKSTKQRNGMLQTRAEFLSSYWAQNCAPLKTVPLNAFPRHFLHRGRHPHGRECSRSLDLRFTEVAGLSPHAGLDRTSNRGLEAWASDTRPPHLGVADVWEAQTKSESTTWYTKN